MNRIRDFYRRLVKKLFNTNIEQTAIAEHTTKTTINQTAIALNFLLPTIVLGIFLILLGIWAIYEYKYSKYNLTPMTGNLNVVVTRFSDWTKGSCNTSKDTSLLIANAFYTRLENDRITDQFYTASNMLLQVRSPGEVPDLKGANEEEITKSAENLANQINAHIVIYGVITCSPITQKAAFQVMFYVAPASISDAQELIGEFSFSSDLLYGEVTTSQDFLDLNKNLQQKIGIISLLVKSIGSFLEENYPQSLTYLSSAMDSSLWENQSGEEVIYIIAGNAETKYALSLLVNGNSDEAEKEVKQAKTYYELANQITVSEGKGEYGRSYIGLAGVEGFYSVLKSVMTNNINDIDISSLDLEQNMLDKAEEASYSPISADIPQKVAFDQAQINLTLYQLKLDTYYLDKARTNYQLVTDAYGQGNLRIREMAAHSYSGLAIIARISKNPVLAISNYKLAIKITRIPSLQAQYMLQLGNTYYAIGDMKNALAYYQETLKHKNDLQNRVPPSIISDLEAKIIQIEQLSPTPHP